MKKIILILSLIILITVLSGCGKKQATKNTNLGFDLNQNVNVEIRNMTDVPAKYYSGNSRYSHGNCTQDSDCYVIGCSLEMCSSDKDMMTTCEILGDVPDKTQYACGCIKDRCGWYLK